MQRTMKMIWASDRKGDEPCASCGRPLKLKTFAVHVIDGGNSVLHPNDESEYNSDGGDMYFFMIGSECAKKFGEFAIKWNR